MKLYLISQDVNGGYDTFDSAVVCANSEEEAKRIHPFSSRKWDDEEDCWFHTFSENQRFAERGIGSVWAHHIDQVEVEYLGEADEKYTSPKIICASFNAG